jgi:hypothetical protein
MLSQRVFKRGMGQVTFQILPIVKGNVDSHIAIH